jgi:hypothetical protein
LSDKKQIVQLTSLSDDEIIAICEQVMRDARVFSVDKNHNLVLKGKRVKSAWTITGFLMGANLTFIGIDGHQLGVVPPPKWIALKILDRVKERP